MESAEIQALGRWYDRAHRLFWDATSKLSDSDLLRRPAPRELPAAWHLWHVGRFADVMQSAFADRPQLWHEKGLAGSWDLRPDRLGVLEVGTGMDQDVSLSMDWRPSELRMYAGAAIESGKQATSLVTTESFDQRVHRLPDLPEYILTFGDILTRSVWHTGRHLGCLEIVVTALAADVGKKP